MVRMAHRPETPKAACLPQAAFILRGSEDGHQNQEDHATQGTPGTASRFRSRAMAPDTKEDVFSLDEGSVILQWPSRLSKASAEDLEDWLALIGRKIKRAAESAPISLRDDDADVDVE